MSNHSVSYKVLVIGNDTNTLQLICQALTEAKRGAFSIESTELLSNGLGRLSEGDIDLIILDLSVSQGNALGTFEKVSACAPEVPIVILAKPDDEALAAEAVRKGAQDYLIKGRSYESSLERKLLQAIYMKKIERAWAKYEHKSEGEA